MQKICAVWGHGGVREFASQPSCYTKLLEALTLRVRLSQTPGSWKLLSHSPGTGWASRCLASEGTKFHSGFAPHVRSPYFAATPATLWGLVLLFSEPCVKSTSHLFLPPCWMKVLGLHLPFVAASQVIFSARTHVLGSKCYSELFRSEVFPFCTWRTKYLSDLHSL